jgi:hypothetical protein
VNSKRAVDQAIKIAIKHGSMLGLSPKDHAQAVKLLELALAEARQVSITYLDTVHPQFASLYEAQYKTGVALMAEGLRTNNTALILKGSYAYNEFAIWVEDHFDELVL